MPITSPSKGKGVLDVKSNHIFANDTERDNYFSVNPTELKEGLYICSNEILQRYENEQFVNRSSIIKGSKGDVGDTGTSIQSITDIESNKIRITLDDGTYSDITKTQASANNITVLKTDFTNLLKDFTGTQTQDLFNFIDEMNEIPNGILYFGEINTENSWKIIKEYFNLNFYRYDLYNSQYNKIASFGASVESDRFILTEWQGSILGKKTDGTKRTLLKTSVDKNGVIIGNKFGRVGLVNGNKLFSMYPTGISSNFKMNECSDAEGIANAQTITNFSTYFKATIDGFYSGLKNIEVIEVPEGTIARFWAISEDKNDIIVEDCSYLNFTKGLGKEIVVGLNDLLLNEPFPIDKDTAVYFNLEFSNPVKLKGSVVDNGVIDDPKFYPMCDVIKEIANLEDLATQDWVRTNIPLSDATDSDSITTAASSKAVNSVRKLVSTAVSGMTYLGGISCEAFSAITIGRKGNYYKLADDGIIFGTSYNAGTSVLINTDFNDRAITVNDCDFFVVEATGTGGIFVTNVTATTSGKNVSITYKDAPNNGCVDSILTDDTSLNVTIEWDRTEDAYCGIPTVNGTTVSSYSNKTGGTYTVTVTIDISSAESIICENNGVVFSVPITKETPPVIQSVTFGNYPINQTSVKENDTMEITITADKSFNQVIVDNFELAKSKTQNVTEGTSATISISCANRGLTTATSQKVRIMVVSPTGSSSGSYTSSTGIMMNNSVPSLTIGTKTYPDGQEALKETEQCTINFTTSKADVVTISSPNGQLNIGTKTATSVQVTRLSENYNIATPNLSFSLKFNENQATATVITIINIVNVPATLTSTSAVQIRSGIGNVSVTCTFSQAVKISSVTIPKGTLGSATSTSTYSTSYNGLISADDVTEHSLSNVNMTIGLVGMSGITATVYKPFYVKGFGAKTLTFTYPEYTKAIGTTVVDPLSIVCSGTLNVSPAVTIATTYDSSGACDDVREFGIIDNNTLKLSSDLVSFYYSTGITCTVDIYES